jgi:hypothetical protein
LKIVEVVQANAMEKITGQMNRFSHLGLPHGEGESFTIPLKIRAPGWALIFRPCLPGHGQTPARRLHLP